LPACSAIFNSLQTQYLQNAPRYANLGLIDAGGKVYCSVLPVSGPIDVSGQTYFQNAVQTLSFSLGDYQTDPIRGQAALNVGYPVLDFSGRVRLVIFASLDLGWLSQLAAQAQLPPDSTFTVVDRQGAILIDYPDGEGRVGQTLDAPILAAIREHAGRDGAVEATDAGGVPRLYAFSPLSTAAGDTRAATVTIGVPAREAFAEGDAILSRSLVTLGLAGLFALGVAWIVGDRFILRPVQALAQAARRVSAGDLGARSGLSRADPQGEFGQLAHAFDQMAETLQQRQIEQERAAAELRRSEELYRTLARNFPKGAVILFDRDLRYLVADGAGLAEVGLSKDMLEGKTVRQIFPADVAEILEPRYRAALAGEETAFEMAFAGRVYLVRAHPVRNESGDIFAGLAMTQDISERKQAEEALAKWAHIFEHAEWGVVVGSADGKVLEMMNPAYARMHGYTVEELSGRPIAGVYAPGAEAELSELIRVADETGHAVAESSHIRKDGSIFPVLVDLTAVRDEAGRVLYRVANVQDITDRKRAEHELREREEQYRGVFESSIDGLFIIDLDGNLVDCNPAAARMHGYTMEEFRNLQPAEFIHPDSQHVFQEYLATVKAGEQFRSRAVEVRKDGSVFHIEVIGTQFAYRGRPATLAVVRDISEQVGAEQKLEQRVAERTRELRALLDTSHNVASTLELAPLLGLILDQLRGVVEYSGATIFALDGDILSILGYRGPITDEQARRIRFSLSQAGANRAVIQGRKPVIIPDVRADDPLARAFRTAAGEELATTYAYIRCWMGVPLMVKERVIGMLSLDHGQSHFYTPQHASLALAFASQAAVAIENAQLYEQARQLAALEERQKLARELHDSVSQALYGIALGARTARTWLDRDPGQVAEPLDYVLSLAEAGLAEMRALIFELRPESLETEGLVSALRKQAASIRARHHIEVNTTLCDEPPSPPAVKEALYRIAQEALHNTVKHARASRVDLRLACADGWLDLEVSDDGVGFDASGTFPGHLGLHSMRERAEKVGGRLILDSAPGRGARIRARAPARAEAGDGMSPPAKSG
jgi:PAS domain S-box-containing protein